MQVLLVLIVIISISFIPVFAQEESTARPTIFWHIKVFLEDIHETITSDPIKKAELKIKHAQERQKEIDEHENENRPIPREFEQKRLQKIAGLEDTKKEIENLPNDNSLKEKLNPLAQTISVLRQAGEINDIRIAVSEFHELRKETGSGVGQTVQIETKANQIDNRINNLESVRQNCNERISSLDLAFEDRPYERLQEICPILKSIPSTKALSILNGDA